MRRPKVDSGARRLRRRKPWRTEFRARFRGSWRYSQWWAIAALGLAAMILGFIGFRDYQVAVGASASFWEVLYRDVQLFVLESGAVDDESAVPVSLQIARLLAPAVAGVALVRAFAPLFRDELQGLRFRLAGGHVVVCGLGRKGLLLSRSLREQGYRVVAIERDEDNDRIETARVAGVPVFVGDATDATTLRRAGTRGARYVVAVCGGDGVNAEIAVTTHRLLAGRTEPLVFLAHVTDPRLCALLQGHVLAAPGQGPIRLDFFNVYERGAQALLLRHPPFPDDDPPGVVPSPHLLVVGLGRLGAGLVVQAARNWSAGDHGADRRLCVTVVDLHAESKVRSLLIRHPEVGEVCDLVGVTLDVETPEFQQGALLDGDAVPVTSAYVCFDSDARSLETALVLHHRLSERSVPIVMRAVTEAGLPALLRQRTDDELQGLHAFALLDRTCDADLLLGGTTEVIARALHDVYRRAREHAGWSFGTELDETRRTDPALAPWDELPEDLRESNRDQSAHTPVKLQAVGCELEELAIWCERPFSFADDEVEALAEMEHARWVDERKRQGWLPGPRDPSGKRTPYLVAWAELSDDVREFDRAFVRSLPAILAKLGYRIVRVTPQRAADQDGSSGGPVPG